MPLVMSFKVLGVFPSSFKALESPGKIVLVLESSGNYMT